MFTKHEFKLQILTTLCWGYVKWCISIVKSTIPLVDLCRVKVRILALPYKSTHSFVEIFSYLKCRLVNRNLR